MPPSTLLVNKREVRLTHLEKLLWPDDRYAKQELIRYLIEVSPYLLPHLKGRPLVVQRFPEGIEGEGFYQKNLPSGAPPWLHTLNIAHQDGKATRYLAADNLETLVWLGNQSCLELHPWLSSAGTLENPDFAVFDLDPMERSTFRQVCRVALTIKELLGRLNLRCYPKTSGATGLQVYMPLAARYSYRQVRLFAEAVCRQAHEALPEITTMERLIGRRQGKIYLDYLQNVRGKTLVAPYSPRPLPGAPVSMPLDWAELSGATWQPGSFTISTALERLKKGGDRFAAVLSEKQALPVVPEEEA